MGALLVAGAAAGSDLTPAQRDLVERDELAIVQEVRPGSPWPAMTVYAFIDATPEEAAAVFTDYNSHSTFIPELLKSRISKTIDPATVEVDCVVQVPVFPDEEYTVRDHVSRDSATAGYRVDWTLVRASSTKGTVGHALFSAYTNARTGKAGTLMEYHNFVTPGSRLAGIGFVKGRAMRQMGETVRAMKREVLRGRSGPEMPRRIAALRAALR